ncbi:MAG TPA: NAD+ synthase, partial [Gammaproteobacteria bacterium]|nr:NAD+ synthase [Gammaproteobacteria bacterium]
MTGAVELRLVVAQVDMLVGDIHGNVTRLIAEAERARDELGAQVVVFPELAVTGYPPEDLLLRPDLYEWVDEELTRLRKAVHGITLIFGYPEKTPHGVYNAALVLRDGRILANARKRYLPNYAVFDEKRYFIPGQEACVVELEGVP